MLEPLVSVIIVNHNGIDFIGDCLKSVLESKYGNLEVIFVDNGSSDGSIKFVRENFNDRRLKIIANNGSLGPAKGRNIGAREAGGKYLIFLDNDTKIEAGAIAELIKPLEREETIGAAQAKLLRMGMDRMYDCAGDYLGPLGFLIERSKGVRDIGQFDYQADILSAKSAASVIRSGLFKDIGGFDDDYYMYLEETDLSFRVWLSGFRVVFAPNAVVYHAFNTPKKKAKKYYSRYIVRYCGCRNYISTLIKNLQFRSLLKILPLHICSWVTIAFLFLFKGSIADFYYIVKGISWNIFNIGLLIKKRNKINNQIRRVSDRQVFLKIKSQETLGDYFKKLSLYLTTTIK